MVDSFLWFFKRCGAIVWERFGVRIRTQRRRLDMRQYKSSGIAPFFGVLLAVCFGALAGAVVGGIWFAKRYFIHIDLFVIFQFLAGIAVGYFVWKGVEKGKIRNVTVAVLIGVFCGLVTVGVFHFLDYQILFKNTVHKAYSQNGQVVSNKQEQIFEDSFLKKEVKQKGFIGFLKFRAKIGISFSNNDGTPMPLNGIAA